MRARDDDVLLDALGRALGDPDVEPSAAEVAALHHAVAVSGAAAAHRRARRRGWIAGVSAGLVLGLTGTAAAVNSGSVPAPVQDAAHEIGLPVDPRRVDDAKDAIDDLREDLEDRDRRKVSESAIELRIALAALTDGERRSVQAEADAVLAQADAFLATPVPTTAPPAPAPTVAPPVTEPAEEDNSGRGRGGDEEEREDEDRSGSNSGSG